MPTPAIEVNHLRKVFGEKVAVEDLTLAVNTAKFLVFSVQTVQGKTTSVKMLLSLIQPTSGGRPILGNDWGRQMYGHG